MSRTTSEMEGAVLGVVSQEGPCTAYAIRRRFLDSPSPRWSGSAGAIYPLVKRLEGRGLISSTVQKGSRRKGRLYSLTPAGLGVLKSWLAPPLDPLATGVPPDPLRTRLSFLGALTPAERRDFIREALAGNKAQIKVVKADLRGSPRKDDPWRHLVARGALASLRARQAWLREVGKALALKPSRGSRRRRRRPGRAGGET